LVANNPAKRPSVALNPFGGRVHYDIKRLAQRLLQYRRCGGAIDTKQPADGVTAQRRPGCQNLHEQGFDGVLNQNASVLA